MAAGHNFRFRTDYWADTAARAAFKRFINGAFHLNLDSWEAAGYWDDAYRPFSLFAADGQIVASVCLYSMRMVIAGCPTLVGQISGMAVLPELRRQGLGRQLTETALRWAADHGHKFIMLFSSEAALPYYRALGFTMTPEHRPVLRLAGGGSAVRDPRDVTPGIRPLDMDLLTDRILLHRLACNRSPVSRQIGVLNDRLLMLLALVTCRQAAYYIPQLDVAVLCRRRDSTLTLCDVIGPRMPTFAELAPFVLAPGDHEVVFWFMTDSLGDLAPYGLLEQQPLEGNNLHLQNGLPVPSPFVFPFTSQA